MNTKHTPGPWKQWQSTIREALTVLGGDGSIIATFDTWKNGAEQEQEANARLIAAAPDMLAMLERVTEAYAEMLKNNGYTWSTAVDSSRALIAKIKVE